MTDTLSTDVLTPELLEATDLPGDDTARRHLVGPAELHALLGGPTPPVVLDVRWSLAAPDGRPAHRAGRVPGAVYVDLERELAGHGAPTDGRHPLPAVADLQAAARRWGVRADRPVVVADDAGGQSAARAWWLLRWAGLTDVRVLDGGLGAWRAAGLPLESGDAPAPVPGDVVLSGGYLPTVDADGAAALARDGRLLDARAGERYRGEVEPVDPRAGHIPGAVSAPTAENLGADGRLLPADALAARFAALGVRPDVPVGVSCGSGVTAAHEALALTVAGYAPVLFPGSWSAWSNDPARPVATGPEPDGTPAGATVATRTWTEPDGIAPRGTLVVLVGRGETPEVYERFGRRLSADAYRIVAVDEGRHRREAVAALLADASLPAPRVLVGVDAGALAAVTATTTAAAAGTPGPDAVVLVGLPGAAEPGSGPWGGSWSDEVAARTACPNHRKVLDRAARSGIGASVLGSSATTVLSPARAARAALGVPVLALHGAADAISPAVDAVPLYRRLGAGEVVLVEDGLHDVLNDVAHRTVAATLVLFLERLRLRSARGGLAPIARDVAGERA
ncbi:hypothetical protein Cma02nite_11310 [Cellulomonas marina]|uniref:3-mercaptopyruvate sulfurtransferase SseA, contains two rhodanese domains n=1 Tax=Cellulomonas marina TaxID=988821 RepID=A0A1I0ZG00_9CELL|nr:hypothetical protein Cma02nite_11310 [Cellulomonas marina]SFB24451.1 3-mercaptopyruvate sulfurtransferase SseA, contains two rhodanese domains [Cellulomonas marina]